eukprot:TRINITY_DN3127_c0_g2_i3.p1 TRINITY_DN3127_c0_g2~~TRINITY_DN3127_c0_g2_i3.p1  ORF type:complete len:856 (-),score=141.06 TRINITY_DN3127_c0_g2_i3:148-2715(-)
MESQLALALATRSSPSPSPSLSEIGSMDRRPFIHKTRVLSTSPSHQSNSSNHLSTKDLAVKDGAVKSSPESGHSRKVNTPSTDSNARVVTKFREERDTLQLSPESNRSSNHNPVVVDMHPPLLNESNRRLPNETELQYECQQENASFVENLPSQEMELSHRSEAKENGSHQSRPSQELIANENQMCQDNAPQQTLNKETGYEGLDEKSLAAIQHHEQTSELHQHDVNTPEAHIQSNAVEETPVLQMSQLADVLDMGSPTSKQNEHQGLAKQHPESPRSGDTGYAVIDNIPNQNPTTREDTLMTTGSSSALADNTLLIPSNTTNIQPDVIQLLEKSIDNSTKEPLKSSAVVNIENRTATHPNTPVIPHNKTISLAKDGMPNIIAALEQSLQNQTSDIPVGTKEPHHLTNAEAMTNGDLAAPTVAAVSQPSISTPMDIPNQGSSKLDASPADISGSVPDNKKAQKIASVPKPSSSLSKPSRANHRPGRLPPDTDIHSEDEIASPGTVLTHNKILEFPLATQIGSLQNAPAFQPQVSAQNKAPTMPIESFTSQKNNSNQPLQQGLSDTMAYAGSLMTHPKLNSQHHMMEAQSMLAVASTDVAINQHSHQNLSSMQYRQMFSANRSLNLAQQQQQQQDGVEQRTQEYADNHHSPLLIDHGNEAQHLAEGHILHSSLRHHVVAETTTAENPTTRADMIFDVNPSTTTNQPQILPEQAIHSQEEVMSISSDWKEKKSSADQYYPGTNMYFGNGMLGNTNPTVCAPVTLKKSDRSLLDLHMKSCQELVSKSVIRHVERQPQGPDENRIRRFLDRLVRPSQYQRAPFEALSEAEASIVQVLFHNMAVDLAHAQLSQMRNRLRR